MAACTGFQRIAGCLLSPNPRSYGSIVTYASRKQRYSNASSSATARGQYDVVIVGGGIVGMATAQQLVSQHPHLSFAVVEKESELAFHQSGRNSGVIHAGMYYTPGSLKAKLCVKGLDMTYKYCDQHQIPYKKCGKLIVAVEDSEVPRLEKLYERGLENGVRDLKMVGSDKIKDIEPNCVGLKAIHSPHTGIIDWGVMTKHYGKQFEKLGGRIYTDFPVKQLRETTEGEAGSKEGLKYPVTIVGDASKNQAVKCRYVVTCAGLHADKVASLSGCSYEPRVVPFRGEYLLLSPEKSNLVNGNIYPVPDPRFPFLGVHFTPRMDGSVWLGPNAVLAFKREGYSYFDISLPDLYDALSFRGLRKLAWKHLGFGVREMYKGIYIRAQVKQLQRFVPQLRPQDVSRGPTGVRAQALARDGSLVDDFVFDQGEGQLGKCIIHVRNSPSPAATSSLAIGEMIAEKVDQTFAL